MNKKGSLTITKFIIGIIIFMLVASAISLFMAEMNNKYTRSDYNESELDSLAELSRMVDTSEDIKNESESININPLEQSDLLGGYFGSAYQALKLAGKSLDVGIDLTNVAAEKTDIPHMDLIRTALITILIVAITIGIIISAAIKKDV